MNLTESLLSGILIGIIIWIATNVATFIVQRYRLEQALLADIKHRRQILLDYRQFLETLFQEHIQVGQKIVYYANVTEQTSEFYDDIRKDLYKYFGATNLIKIMRLYEALWEIEILLQGLLGEDLPRWGNDERALSAEDVAFLARKKTRIINIIDILERGELRSVKDLPQDYQGTDSSSSMIRR